jgi:hypothetical protein
MSDETHETTTVSDETLASDETPPETTAPEVEPLLGLDAFVHMQAIKPPLRAAIYRWMLLNTLDPHGHCSASQWHAYLQRTLAHT